MKVNAHLDTNKLSEIAEQAARAEALGFDSLALAELTLDPFLCSLLAAEHTRHADIKTAIAVAFPRSPMTTAYMAWNIQQVAGGRFELGLGTQVKGHNERRFSTPWLSPGPRLKEYIASLRAIWDTWQNGTPLNFRGEFYNFTLMIPVFDPGPIPHPRIPISISAVNKYMLRLGGEVADGVQLHSFCTPKYVAEVVLPQIEEGAKKVGRSLQDVAVTGGCFVIAETPGKDLDAQVAAVRQRIAFYASTRTYKPVMDVHGWGDVTLELHRLSLKGMWQEMTALITDEMLDAFAIFGSYDDLPGLIEKRYGGWASSVDLGVPDGPDEGVKQALDKIKQIA